MRDRFDAKTALFLEALRARVAERPEWTRELVRPVYRRAVVTTLTPALELRATEAGLSVDEYVVAAEHVLRELLTDAAVVKRIWPASLDAALHVGAILPLAQYAAAAAERGVDFGLDSRHTVRHQVELEAFGQHPVYAYLAEPGMAPIGDPALDMYGPIALSLRRDVLTRCTFTVADSVLEKRLYDRLPCPVTDPSVYAYPLQRQSHDPIRRRTLAGSPTRAWVADWKRGNAEPAWSPDLDAPAAAEQYMEIQILGGGVSVHEIDHVTIDGTFPWLEDLLDEDGIPWSRGQVGWRTERDSPSPFTKMLARTRAIVT